MNRETRKEGEVKTTDNTVAVVDQTFAVIENRRRTSPVRKDAENLVSLELTQALAPYLGISKFPQERTLREL